VKKCCKSLWNRFNLYLVYLLIGTLSPIIIYILIALNIWDKAFTFIIIPFMLGKVYKYIVDFKEIYLRRIYKKRFNKEYFDLYWNNSALIIQSLAYSFYISILWISTDNAALCKIKKIIYSTCSYSKLDIVNIFFEFVGFVWLRVFICLFMTLGILIVWMNKAKDNKKIDKLMRKKKDNFGPYTPSEKAIILE